MKLTNYEMSRRLGQLGQVLDRADLIGYAAARNTRVLREACSEYLQMQDALVRELGEPETDGEGAETGAYRLDFASPNFPEFARRMDEIAPIESEIEVFRIRVDEAIGKLSGTQLLELDWMFED
ncbi:hypothetical protein VJ923_07340 [Adlercreutzia sp. R25]|uniref:hypothetical protein n=1 Tax=Adlercreutzia shanghongiae TaxID=3111773 RepID=UPI002DC01342|nr:hypothetical protein [Adlercreutzia sp. R25]MEC4272968.1 hypothetical protein [Adlercreutzia sp. R25]